MTPAEHVIKKCGGAARTSKIVERAYSTVHKWKYDKEKGGTGGIIPASAQAKILEAADRGEVDVRPEDFFRVPASAAKKAAS